MHAAGEVRFGFAGKGLWAALNQLRTGPARKGIVSVWPALVAQVKFFGRHKAGIRVGRPHTGERHIAGR